VATATSSFYPACAEDDGDNTTDSGFVVSGSVLRVGCDYVSTSNNAFIRFPNVTIPDGATVTEVTIYFTSRYTATEAGVKLNVYFNNVVNAVAPVSAEEFDALSLTAAISWSPGSTWVSGNTYDPGSLLSIFNTIVTTGWVSGNSIICVLRNNTGVTAKNKSIRAYNTSPAELRVTYNYTIEDSLTEVSNVSGVMDTNAEDTAESATVGATMSTNMEILTEAATSNVVFDFEQVKYGIDEDANASVVMFVNSKTSTGSSISESATAAVAMAAHRMYFGNLATTTPVFTGTGKTGIGSHLSASCAMFTSLITAGFHIAVNSPYPVIEATGGIASTAIAEVNFPAFSINAHSESYAGAVFEGVSPLFTIDAFGQIVPVASLHCDMMMFSLNTYLHQSKDFVNDILWFDKEGIVGYLQQPQMEYTISGSAS
jgi:hypothetical protein